MIKRLAPWIAAVAVVGGLSYAGPADSAPARNPKCCPGDPCYIAGGTYHPSCK